MLQQALPRCLLLIETLLYGCLDRVNLILERFELRFQIYSGTHWLISYYQISITIRGIIGQTSLREETLPNPFVWHEKRSSIVVLHIQS